MCVCACLAFAVWKSGHLVHTCYFDETHSSSCPALKVRGQKVYTWSVLAITFISCVTISQRTDMTMTPQIWIICISIFSTFFLFVVSMIRNRHTAGGGEAMTHPCPCLLPADTLLKRSHHLSFTTHITPLLFTPSFWNLIFWISKAEKNQCSILVSVLLWDVLCYLSSEWLFIGHW